MKLSELTTINFATADAQELEKLLNDMEKQMRKAAAELNFESAMELRDKIKELSVFLNES